MATLSILDASGKTTTMGANISWNGTFGSWGGFDWGTKSISDFKPTRVVFSDNVTVCFWSDGSKTMVVCGENDVFDLEHGVAMCVVHKMFGSRNQFKKFVKKNGTVLPNKETRDKRKEELKAKKLKKLGNNE